MLAQAQRNQGLDAMSSDCMLPAELTGILISFLTNTSLDWSLQPTASAWSSQRLRLGFVRNLWICVRKTLPSSALYTAANKLLNKMIAEEFSLGQPVVSEAWSQLFTELYLSLSAENYQHHPSITLHSEPLESVFQSIQETVNEPEEVLAPEISQVTGTPSQEWVCYSTRIESSGDIILDGWQPSVSKRQQ